MKHGSLFSGIGGFDLAAEWAGWENIFHCEWNPFGQKVLNHYWPNAESFTDITKTDFKKYANTIDILTGGFPCQPYSVAGKRKGKEDDRHLWPEMLRAIREIKPRYIVGENVSGLVSWDRGLVFEEVQTDLEAEGYKVQAVLLPACAVDAPHRRDRVWFVAYSSDNRNRQLGESRESQKIGSKDFEKQKSRIKHTEQLNESHEFLRFTTYSASNGYDAESNKGSNTWRENNKQSGKGWVSSVEGLGNERTITNTASIRGNKDIRIGKSRLIDEASQTNDWQNFPTQSPVCDGNDGLSTRLDGITFPKWRNESIKAGGNAIVPQVAFEIFKVINQLEQ